MRRAVIDVGSNSVLLLVAERQPTGWTTLLETSAVTALGDGTKATGLLTEGAMTRTLAAIAEAHRRAHELGVDDIRTAATMAARIATNAPDFIARGLAQGTPITILSGEEEAELGFRSVANDPIFAQYPRLSIIDPGGQSTELVTADRTEDGWDVRFRRSYPIGTLGLKSTTLAPEVLTPREILSAVAEVDDRIGLAYRPGEGGHAVVLGATGTNLVSIRDQLLTWQPELVHGAILDFEEVSKAVGWMMPMTNAERAAIPGMEPGREKTIHIGALILERFLNALKVLNCSVSIRGWRYALLDQ
ncbi:MAG: hypothetical protein ACOYON_02290 [Fimbriimonas sp.]